MDKLKWTRVRTPNSGGRIEFRAKTSKGTYRVYKSHPRAVGWSWSYLPGLHRSRATIYSNPFRTASRPLAMLRCEEHYENVVKENDREKVTLATCQ